MTVNNGLSSRLTSNGDNLQKSSNVVAREQAFLVLAHREIGARGQPANWFIGRMSNSPVVQSAAVLKPASFDILRNLPFPTLNRLRTQERGELAAQRFVSSAARAFPSAPFPSNLCLPSILCIASFPVCWTSPFRSTPSYTCQPSSSCSASEADRRFLTFQSLFLYTIFTLP